jgi:hypothetical protein
VVSFIHGRAGDVMPACMPDCSVRAANVPVSSMIFWLRRSPLLRSVVNQRGRRGRT